jgi:hypothetical protein
MSGGEWDYFHRRFYYDMEDFCKDIEKRFPELSKELLRKVKLYTILSILLIMMCVEMP